MPSGTGFSITIRENFPALESFVEYLECINAPTTDISLICTIFERCLIKEKLKLPAVICVFGQAIYSKAAKIKWINPAR